MIRWPAYIVIAGALVVVQPAIGGTIVAAAQSDVDAEAPLAAHEPAARLEGDEEAGREAYAESCRGCHSGAIAPSLKGVAGRAIASVPGYTYSPGLKAKAAKTWTAAELDAFIARPREYAPGTKMFKAVDDAQQRADIIAYLQSMSA